MKPESKLALGAWITLFVICSGFFSYVASIDNANREESKLRATATLVEFCGNEPVEVTNTYLMRHGNKPATSYTQGYAVVKYKDKSITVTLNTNKPVNIGESWYLTVENTYGTHYDVTLDRKAP